MTRLPLILIALSVILMLASCSPGYVLQAAYTEGKILWNREDIQSVIDLPATTPDDREKLTLVLEARAYSENLGLTPGEAYTTFSRVDEDVLAWVVVGCRDDAFELHTWWFPIVGTVPYKGFFEKEEAQEQAQKLEADHYETWVRGTDAFSTLGWFNDPVLSTTLKNSETRIVNTVIHEILHATLWIKGHVEYNESLANFVGLRATITFFEEKLKRCGDNDECLTRNTARLQEAKTDYERSLELARVIEHLYQSLDTLYRSDKTREEKLRTRRELFDQALAGFRTRFPRLTVLNRINNAEILQMKLYLTRLDDFQRLFNAYGGDMKQFIQSQQTLAETLDSREAPYEALIKLIDGRSAQK